MSSRHTNFEFARAFLDNRIGDTDADVPLEEDGARFTTPQNQFVDISRRRNNGVLIFAMVDIQARDFLHVNVRARTIRLHDGMTLRLEHIAILTGISFIRLQFKIINRGVLGPTLETLARAIEIGETGILAVEEEDVFLE